MDKNPEKYIHMVHHLIEECLVLTMSKEQCMDVLARHANINPVVTSTVWEELERVNKEFFEAYERKLAERAATPGMVVTREMVQNMVANSTLKDTKDQLKK